MISTRCLEKASQKTLRFSHISHSPDGGDHPLKRPFKTRLHNYRARFYERGCQDKYPPTDRPPEHHGWHGSQPLSPLRRFRCPTRVDNPSFVIASCASQKLKSDWRLLIVCRPWFYSSLSGLMLFRVVRGGIESTLGLRPKSWTILTQDPHPRPYPLRTHPTTSG